MLLELAALADQVPEPTGGALLRIREATRESLDEVRAVARALRPHVLEDLGLRSALTALTTDLFGTTGVHVRRGLDPGLPELDSMVELVLFRVSQEALTNAARHSGAATVELTLSRSGSEVVLSVADDGRWDPHWRRRRRPPRHARARRACRRKVPGGPPRPRRHSGDPRRAAGIAIRNIIRCLGRPGSCSPTTTRWYAAGCA